MRKFHNNIFCDTNFFELPLLVLDSLQNSNIQTPLQTHLCEAQVHSVSQYGLPVYQYSEPKSDYALLHSLPNSAGNLKEHLISHLQESTVSVITKCTIEI